MRRRAALLLLLIFSSSRAEDSNTTLLLYAVRGNVMFDGVSYMAARNATAVLEDAVARLAAVDPPAVAVAVARFFRRADVPRTKPRHRRGRDRG